MFLFLPLLSPKKMLPSIDIRNGVHLLCLYLVEEGGKDPPGLLQFITGSERAAFQVNNEHIKTK